MVEGGLQADFFALLRQHLALQKLVVGFALELHQIGKLHDLGDARKGFAFHTAQFLGLGHTPSTSIQMETPSHKTKGPTP